MRFRKVLNEPKNKILINFILDIFITTTYKGINSLREFKNRVNCIYEEYA